MNEIHRQGLLDLEALAGAQERKIKKIIRRPSDALKRTLRRFLGQAYLLGKKTGIDEGVHYAFYKANSLFQDWLRAAWERRGAPLSLEPDKRRSRRKRRSR